MRWLAIHMPGLPLEIFRRGISAPPSLALYQRMRGRNRVRLADAAALAQGVRPGMDLGAARAIGETVCFVERDPQREQETLHGLAAWAGRFTPMVVLDPPRGLLLEVAGSQRLFGGNGRLRQGVGEGLARLGFHAVLCQAPTAIAASLLARAGHHGVIDDLAQLRALLYRLPLDCLPLKPAKRKLTRDLGLVTLGDLTRLPRQGLRQRFGGELLGYLDKALGDAPDLRRPFEPAPRFRRRLELLWEISDSQALLAAARPLIDELEGYLISRQLGVREVSWQLHHPSGLHTELTIGQGEPGRDGQRLARLLEERLHHCPLTAPVREIGLRAERPEPLRPRPAPRSLFPELEPAERESGAAALTSLLDLLRARLGNESVHMLADAQDPRPESIAISQSQGRRRSAASPRPLWLLHPPEPLRQYRGIPYRGGRLTLEGERERIETGWWDGRPIARDYFIAHAADGQRLWIYRDLHQQGAWYLHGLFG